MLVHLKINKIIFAYIAEVPKIQGVSLSDLRRELRVPLFSVHSPSTVFFLFENWKHCGSM